ncbi:MAG: SpoIIE family protein phosphatase [Sphingobacteriaceae bacterium]
MNAQFSAKADSLLTLLNEAQNDTNKVNLHLNYARYLDYFRSSERIEQYVAAVNLAKQLEYSNGVKRSYTTLITVLLHRNMFDISYAYCIEYMSYLNQNGFNDDLMELYNSYATLLSKKGKSARALEFYNKSLDHFYAKKNYKGYANVLNNISILYNDKNELDSAFFYQLRALEIFRSNNQQSEMANSILGIAEIYLKKNDLANADMKANESKDIYLNAGIELGVINANLILAKINLQQGKAKEGIEKINEALKLSEKYTIYAVKRDLYFELTNLYHSVSDDKNAFLSHKLYKQFSDSVSELQLQAKTLEMDVKYDITQKDRELERQSSLIELQSKERTFLIYGILIAVLLLSISIYAFLQKQKSNQIISKQKKLVEEKQLEILDSIHYAKRIQNTLITNKAFIDASIPNNFIYFQPKDIVSGDFYWATQKDNKFYIAVCDSTGHGVPGAFMSLMNITFLNEAINQKNIVEVDEVFNYVREKLIENLGKDGQKDGFDGILLCLDRSKQELNYVAANNSPILISKNEMIKLPCNKMPVGMGERSEKFTKQNVPINKGDKLYLYTDGFADQFGGLKEKKFMYKQLNELLLNSVELSLSEQRDLLHRTFEHWKGDHEQVDDVCVIGIGF